MILFWPAITLGVLPSRSPVMRVLGVPATLFFAWLLVGFCYQHKPATGIYFTPTRIIVNAGAIEYEVRWRDVRQVAPQHSGAAYLIECNPWTVAIRGPWFQTLGRKRRSRVALTAATEAGILLIPLFVWCQERKNRSKIGTDTGRAAFQATLDR
jgi:hypothetical protein